MFGKWARLGGALAVLLAAAGSGQAQHSGGRGGGGGGHGGGGHFAGSVGGRSVTVSPAGGGRRVVSVTNPATGRTSTVVFNHPHARVSNARVAVFAGGRAFPFAPGFYGGGYYPFGGGAYSPFDYGYGGYATPAAGDYSGYNSGYYSPSAYSDLSGNYGGFLPGANYGGFGPGLLGYQGPPMPYAPGPPMPNANGNVPEPQVPPAPPEEDRKAPPAPAAPAEGTPVAISLHVPADAEVWIDGTLSRQTGTVRQFLSPPLAPGRDYVYRFRARWVEGGRVVDYSREVNVRAGDNLSLNFATATRGPKS